MPADSKVTRTYVTVEQLRNDTWRCYPGQVARSLNPPADWILAIGGWIEYLPARDVVKWNVRDFINMNTPKETPMPDKTYIPEPGDIVVWVYAGGIGGDYSTKPMDVLGVRGDKVWVIRDGHQDAEALLVEHESGHFEKIVPKEVWEEPRPTTMWFGIRRDGRFDYRAVANPNTVAERTHEENWQTDGCVAVVECDVTPRLDTLREVG